MEEDAGASLSPTVTQVFEELISRVRADDRLGGAVADGLDALLSTGAVPKPEELLDALIGPEGESQR